MTTWDARTGGGSATRLASAFETLLLNYSDTRSRLPGIFYAADYSGYDNTGASNSHAAIISAVNAAHAAGGGYVMLGRGDFMLGSQLAFTNGCQDVTVCGAGKGVTRLFRNPASTTYLNMLGGVGYQNVVFQDITCDGGGLFEMFFVIGDDWRGTVIQRCEMKNWLTNAIYAYASRDARVSQNDFFDETGKATARAITHDLGGTDWTIEDNTFDWCNAGLYAGGGNVPAYNVRVLRNRLNGHYWNLPIQSANSGGTVTYGASSVTDSSAPFAALVAGYAALSRMVRVLKSEVTGTSTFSTFNGRLQDAGASFTNVKEGWEIRTSTKRCVVERVGTVSTANDTVYCGQWYELGANWGKKTTQPSGSTAYTIYRPYIGRVNSMSSTVLTLDAGWSEFGTGATATPAAGTLYELMVLHNDMTGFFLGSGSHDSLVQGNTIEGTYREGIFNWASSAQVLGNKVRFTQDYGITYDGNTGTTPGTGGVISGNECQSCGAGSIYVGTDDVLVTGNDCEGSVTSRYAVGSGAIILNAKRIACTSNKLTNTPASLWEQGSAFAAYGVLLWTAAQDCLVAHNHSRGVITADFYADASSGPNNKMFDNDGTIGVNASATAPLVKHQGSGAPGFLAGKGSTWFRNDGGAGTTFYVNEAGTTTWVAK